MGASEASEKSEEESESGILDDPLKGSSEDESEPKDQEPSKNEQDPYSGGGFQVPAESQEQVSAMVFDDSASFYLEAALSLASEEIVSLICRAHLIGNLQALVLHRSANFVAQSLFMRLYKFRDSARITSIHEKPSE